MSPGCPWRGAGVVERGGLENRCTPLGYRGFESHPLRMCRRPMIRRRAAVPFLTVLAHLNPFPLASYKG